MAVLRDLTGLVFNRLTVLERIHGAGRARWLCQCSCGNKCQAIGYHIRAGLTKSCGCLRAEISGARNRTHGKSGGGGLYTVWRNMNQRCSLCPGQNFKDYGGRGIAVCERWKDFAAFQADMGAGYATGLSLERKDVNLGYDIENCLWIPLVEQSKNKTSTVRVVYQGETLCLSDAARRAGVQASTALYRVNRLGWTPEEALQQPTRKAPPKVRWLTVNGEQVRLADAARQHGLTSSQLFKRLRRGWSVDEALKTPLHGKKEACPPTE